MPSACHKVRAGSVIEVNAAGGHPKQDMGARIDPESFKRYFDEHYGFICRVATGIVCDRADAEDVAQETFMSLFLRPPKDPGQSIRGWLTVVAVNTALNHLRRDKARARREAGAAELEGASPLLDVPLDNLTKAEAGAVARGALEALDARDRAVLIMRSSGLNYREIARAVNVKETSVGTIIARAKSAFKAAYANLGGSDGNVL